MTSVTFVRELGARALVCALALGTCNLATADGLLNFAASSDGSINPTIAANSQRNSSSEQLLAVGPLAYSADGNSVSVLGQVLRIAPNTKFSRGLAKSGDYVAIAGTIDSNGVAVASNVVRLGGSYVMGSSLVYLRGTISAFNRNGSGSLGQTQVDLAGSFHDSQFAAVSKNDVVELIGFEYSSGTRQVVAAVSGNILQSSKISGINGSGLNGINGSGLNGINGSGLKGINGSGLNGINGSGLQGINGSGLNGINGSGLNGINGSGLNGINGSGLQGINGSGLKGINGSGLN